MERRWVGVVATVEALATAGTVAAMAWYAVARNGELAERLQRFDRGGVGLVVMCTVLLAGALLAFAFGKAEEAVVVLRQARKDVVETDE